MDGADTAAGCSATRCRGPRVDTVWQAIAVGTIAGLAHRFGPVGAVAKMGIADLGTHSPDSEHDRSTKAHK
jgi:hypothetical protein